MDLGGLRPIQACNGILSKLEFQDYTDYTDACVTIIILYM